MVKVRVFEVQDGNMLMSYASSVVPRIGEGMFINDVQCRVVDVHHITQECYEDILVLESVEVEVEIVA